MKIIYHSEQDATEFDKARYLKSLNKYGKVSSEQVDKALEEFINNDVLHVITTQKDIDKLREYMVARINSRKPNFMNKIKRFLGISEPPEFDRDLPVHLAILSEALKLDKQEAEAFSQYSKNAVAVNSAKELFFAVMRER